MESANQSLGLDLTPPITSWLDDETFYSLCCRFHYVFGNALDSKTARQLFDHPQHGTQHDFPSRINIFIERMHGMFGTNAKALIYKHTILRFYLPWRHEQQAQAIVQAMCNGHVGKIKSLLGLPASRMRANHPLRACPVCMQSDKQQHGVSYWHLSHQLPGVWVCPIHACALKVSTMKSNGIGRFLWCLPHEDSFYSQAPGFNEEVTVKALKDLSSVAAAIFSLDSSSYIDPLKLASTYRQALEDYALLRGRTQIALKDATDQYLQFTKQLNFAGLDIPLPTSQSQASAQLTKILACPPRSTHPLRHMLLILWLFGNWEQFWGVYLQAKPCSQTSYQPKPPAQRPIDPRISELVSLVQDQSMAVSTAARKIGIAVQTAQRWASSQGIAIRRRPKTPKQNLKLIVHDLRQGKDKAEVAHRHQVSIQTIYRLLKTDPRLLARWEKQRDEQKVLAVRRAWKSAIRRNPEAILKKLRTLEPGCYTWLYRHDRDWLVQSVEQIPKHQYEPTGVDWDLRDAQLVDLISNAVRNLKARGSSRITLQKLYQLEPSLKPYLNKLKRLPRTHLLLEQLLCRNTHQSTTVR
ncbi:hypothetical protein D7I39_03070 [Allopusillimonas ginsengisoli]|nr:hypothetical protein D7I39_03070 [Allopusillimonas ginsengisoli]